MVLCTLFIHINKILFRLKINLIWTENYSESKAPWLGLWTMNARVTVHHTNHCTTNAHNIWCQIFLMSCSSYLVHTCCYTMSHMCWSPNLLRSVNSTSLCFSLCRDLSRMQHHEQHSWCTQILFTTHSQTTRNVQCCGHYLPPPPPPWWWQYCEHPTPPPNDDNVVDTPPPPDDDINSEVIHKHYYLCLCLLSTQLLSCSTLYACILLLALLSICLQYQTCIHRSPSL